MEAGPLSTVTRRYYWAGMLGNFIVGIISQANPQLGIILAFLYLPVAVFITVRRLHDVDTSGWWVVPSVVSAITNSTFQILESSRGQYSDPSIFEYSILPILLISGVATFIVFLICAFKPGSFFRNRFDKEDYQASSQEVF